MQLISLEGYNIILKLCTYKIQLIFNSTVNIYVVTIVDTFIIMFLNLTIVVFALSKLLYIPSENLMLNMFLSRKFHAKYDLLLRARDPTAYFNIIKESPTLTRLIVNCKSLKQL